MSQFNDDVEKRLASGCPQDLRKLLMQIQNDLLNAKNIAERNSRQMTEAACDSALQAVRHAMRLCENGS